MDQSKSAARQRIAIRILIGLLLSTILAAGGWLYYEKFQRPRAAFQAICNKGVDANINSGGSVIFFKHGNVTDADLTQFVPALREADRKWGGLGRISRLVLNGSPVSKEALEKFREAVPTCTVDP
jgi:hypothetical protein